MSLFTTLGSKSANSYITVVEADSYLASSPYNLTAWSALTVAQKEYRLILAAKLMNTFSWAGYRVYENQALSFPLWFLDTDTVEIPEDIKTAQAYIAYAVIHRGLTEITNPADGRSSEPEIKRLSLFSSLVVEASENPVVKSDGSLFEALISSEHFPIYLLISDYLTQIQMSPGPLGPIKLAEVA